MMRYGSPARIDITIEHLAPPDTPPTPGEAKRQAVAAQPQLALGPPRKRKETKSKYPAALQARIDEALGRQGGKD